MDYGGLQNHTSSTRFGGRASVPTLGVIDTVISLDGRTLIASAYTTGATSFINILKMSALHGDQHVLTAGKGSMGFAFSPDGQTALVANDDDGTVTVVDLRRQVVASSFKAGTGIENLTYF